MYVRIKTLESSISAHLQLFVAKESHTKIDADWAGKTYDTLLLW